MRKKRIIAVSLILVLSVLCVSTTFSANALIDGSKQIAVTHANLAWSNITPGRMGLYYSVTASDTMDEIGATEVTFYRYEKKEGWVEEETFSYEDYPDMIRTDAATWQITIKRDAEDPDASYKATVYFYAKGDYGVSTVVQDSNVI